MSFLNTNQKHNLKFIYYVINVVLTFIVYSIIKNFTGWAQELTSFLNTKQERKFEIYILCY